MSKVRLVAGVDEAGRGALAGPVVAAAVILPDEIDLPPLLKDSKLLTAQQREEMARWIRRHALAWAVASASVEEIDRLNILQATVVAMHRALAKLHPQPEKILVDGNYFKPFRSIPHQCIVGGDRHVPAIAAASILAKVTRDALMTRLAQQYPDYLWDQNKGYATPTHKEAIRRLGRTPYHRRSFKIQWRLSFQRTSKRR